MKESALNSLAISTIETWSARTRKNSNISAWLAKIVIAAVLAPYIFPMATSLEWKTQYTYANEYHPLELAVPIRLESPKNSFVVELQTESSIADEHAVTFKIFTDTSEKETDLEIMGDETEQGRYFTAPQHFEPSKTIRVECIGCKSLKKPILHLVALDTRTSVEKLSYNPDALVPKSYATISAFPVISRADWGADESLRYADSEIWKKIFKDQSTITPSDAALKIIEKNTAIEAKLREKFPEESKINEVVRKEKGHELVWPIEKTKYVREMVVHHTGEDNLKSLSDLELMRSIYYYHSVVRGWGDIGYQYVVGQRGQVYEGRAG